MTNYKIEFEVSWTPKRSEEDCYEYISKRYPNAVYDSWSKNADGDSVKKCYADEDAKNRNEVKCEIIKSMRKKKNADDDIEVC